MTMANFEVRQAAIDSGVRHCDIAQKLGIHRSNFSRLMRYELADSEKQKILRTIEELALEKDQAQSEAI